ncbi:methyltransferase domain-containing protein [Plantactinospora sp. S1510]|uniref:Methyltransferase domain-containing protein n=1 Tax=Plantactinospora alkalitolerans TaxID=2789879 RepID=A0ABS0H2G9_9ACTN|nr:class I SAM-dependent methyltransferase [Plantactinospora alkalitolerans]MBF9132665.1 methyltransferase domain-containing protein [Plantactinospora alkalitolerans]
MTDTDRELLRATFGQDAELYDQARPGYPNQLFADLAQLAGLTPQSRVLEIGCGTGQATRPLAQLGCTIVAVELSPDMATVARHNLRDFPNVTIEVSPFEDWTPPALPFDLVVSATAFHWIDPDIRFQKAADILRPGGTLAVIYSDHVAGGTERFFIDVQDCYERFDPKTPPGLRLTPAADLTDDSSEFDRSQRFGPAQFRRYEWEQAYTTRSYLDVLMTYSPTRSLPEANRKALLSCIGGLIDRDHNGQVSKRYLTQLTLAHKTT